MRNPFGAFTKGTAGAFGAMQGATQFLMRNGVKTAVIGGTTIGVWQGDHFFFDDAGKNFLAEQFGEGAVDFFTGFANTGADAAQGVANRAAQIGPEAGYHGFASMVEMFGKLVNWMTGGQNQWAIDLMNSARAEQSGKPPLVLVNGNLVEETSLSVEGRVTTPTATPDLTTTPTSVVHMTGAFNAENFKTTINSIITTSPEFRNAYEDDPISADALENAERINSTIKTFNVDKLIGELDRAIDDPALSAQVNELANVGNIDAFTQTLRVGGMEGLTTLFSAMAEGKTTTEALEQTRVTLSIPDAAPTGP